MKILNLWPGTRYSGPERRSAKPPLALSSISVIGFIAVSYATLCPIGMRPHLASADQERFGAYLLLGTVFGLTLPRQWRLMTCIVVAIASILEAGQLLVPGRDGHLHDALVKSLAGIIGVTLGGSSVRLTWIVKRRLQTVPRFGTGQ